MIAGGVAQRGAAERRCSWRMSSTPSERPGAGARRRSRMREPHAADGGCAAACARRARCCSCGVYSHAARAPSLARQRLLWRACTMQSEVPRAHSTASRSRRSAPSSPRSRFSPATIPRSRKKSRMADAASAPLQHSAEMDVQEPQRSSSSTCPTSASSRSSSCSTPPNCAAARARRSARRRGGRRPLARALRQGAARRLAPIQGDARTLAPGRAPRREEGGRRRRRRRRRLERAAAGGAPEQLHVVDGDAVARGLLPLARHAEEHGLHRHGARLRQVRPRERHAGDDPDLPAERRGDGRLARLARLPAPQPPPL